VQEKKEKKFKKSKTKQTRKRMENWFNGFFLIIEVDLTKEGVQGLI